MFESSHDWEKDYQKIKQTHYSEISNYSREIIGEFPNNYCYTKRMAEELMSKKAKVPLIIIRPSIIAASF
jgi:nucleoside-diphosphate-sugar epimerase